MTKEADRWSNFSLGGSSSFIIQRKLSLINAFTVKKISRKCMGHLVIMVKQSALDRFLPLYDFIANARWGVDILVCVCFVLSEFITSKLHVCSLHFTALCHSQEPLFVLSLMFPHSADISSPTPSLRAPDPAAVILGEILAVLGLSGNPSVSPRAQPAPVLLLRRRRNVFLLCWLTIGKALCISDWRKLRFSWLDSSCWCRKAKVLLYSAGRMYWCLRKGRQLVPWHLCLPNSPWLSSAGLDRHSFHGTIFPDTNLTVTHLVEVSLSAVRPKCPHCCSWVEIILPAEQHFQEAVLHLLWAPKYRSSICTEDLYLHRGKPSQLFNKLLSPHPLTTAHLIWKKTHSLYSIDLYFAVLQFNISSAVVGCLPTILK